MPASLALVFSTVAPYAWRDLEWGQRRHLLLALLVGEVWSICHLLYHVAIATRFHVSVAVHIYM